MVLADKRSRPAVIHQFRATSLSTKAWTWQRRYQLEHVCSALIPQRLNPLSLAGSFAMSTFSAVFLKHLTWAIVFVLKAFGSVPSRNASNEFMAYNFDPASRSSHAYAVYDVRAWRGPGTLSFLFNTHKSKAFLAYQDDRTYSNFDLFIDKGNIRARINFDKCPEKEFVIQGNFSDSRWHRVRLTRELRNLTLTVDGCHSTFVPCDMSSSEREEWYVLYVGGIPWSTSYNSLAKPIILFQAMASV